MSSVDKGHCPIFAHEGARAVVLCDGPPPSPELLAWWLLRAEIFVCADGAGHPFENLPRPPDLVIGDLDSIDGRVIGGRDGPPVMRDPDQSTTDSEKALRYLAGKGVTEVVLLGALGWRLDHTLYNCFLLEKFAPGMRVCLAGYEADMVRVAAGDAVAWELPPGTVFSLMPIYGRVEGVTIDGARWPLEFETLDAMSEATVSNEVAASPLQIEVATGAVLVSVARAGWFGG